MAVTLREKLLARIAKTPFGCWLWTGARDKRYGRFRGRLAHRAVYEEFVGLVPAGLELDHLCRNRLCTNPEHLEPVTHRENVLRGDAGKHESVRTHCNAGHEFTPENTVKRRDNGARRCRACARERSATRRRANPEAGRAACRAYYRRKRERWL